MSIDVIAAAQGRAYNPNYSNRAWLAAEMGALIAAQDWATLGGLALHVALAQAPIAGNLAQLIADAAPQGEIDMAAQVAELTTAGSNLQALGLRLAGAVAKMEDA